MTALVRLKHVAGVAVSNVDKKSVEGETPVRLCNYTDVYYNDRITKGLEFMTASASPDQIRVFGLRPGDVLVTKDSEIPEDIAVPALVESAPDDLVCGYHLALIRPDPELVEPRFLFWSLAATTAREWFSAQATGVTRFGLRSQTIADARLRLPGRVEQREIADFLDAETARIDALIEKKRRMIELLSERLRALVTSELFGAQASWVRLGRAVDLLPGFAFSSDLFLTDADRGLRLLRGINVAPGRMRWDETVFLDASSAQAAERFALDVGDLVIGMDRPVIGGGMRVAEIREADVPCLLVQRVARLRVNELAERDWIRLALMSPGFVAYFSPIVTGVSVPHISPDQIAAFKLPLPTRATQRSILRRLLSAERTRNDLTRAAVRQIDLLREHRQALITEAVTGQLELATAS